MSLLKYLFPKRRLQHELPLLPLGYSSKNGHVDPALKGTIDLLKGYNLAKTDADAMRLIRQYKGKTGPQIVKILKRHRRRVPPLKRAWRRFKRLL